MTTKRGLRPWRRGRGAWLGLVLVLVLVLAGVAAGCSPGPSDDALRARARSDEAVARRTVEERKMRKLIRRMKAVKGLEHIRTRFLDLCATPTDGNLFEPPQSPDALECGMRAEVYLGVRGDITDVLRSIRAAHLAPWGSPVRATEGDSPTAGGTVAYALTYQRERGRFPDGTLMPGPRLEAPGLSIDWDRPGLPLPGMIEDFAPCPADGSGRIYQRCEVTPGAPATLAAARARYGTVLVLVAEGHGSSDAYFTVARDG
ncbi:hypothetical protein [Streptomyces sp. NPDC047803]|uniref:hypothetical protein n=1 Tax=Streptomyces TaxID=1883 RepID=UPI003408119C